MLDFTRLCPLKNRERKDTYTHPSGVVLTHFRTRTQATFSMITSCISRRVLRAAHEHWPSLAFIWSVSQDIGQFGGVLTVLDGEVVDLVRDYRVVDYSRRAHGRQIRALLKRFHPFLIDGRPWRLVPHAAWERRFMPFDAHFDDDSWFYFRTRDEIVRFKRRYKWRGVMRRADHGWVRARVR